MKIDSILFDLDGTLWDATEGISLLWNGVFEKHGEKERVTREQVKGFMGKTLDVIGGLIFPELPADYRNQLMDEGAAAENDYFYERGAELFPQLEETLAELSKTYKLAVVSNSQGGYVEAFLHAHGLERYFMDFETAGNTGKQKDENIRLVMERNGLKGTVYVGDTDGDCQAAKAAGVPFILAAYGFGHAEDYAAKLERFSDLPGVLRELER